MSMHYTTGNQYADAYVPKVLGNWQVPLWHPPAPLAKKVKTVVVSNDRGHLLPGIPRSKGDPWGNYINTWNLPKKISRETARQLSAPNQIHVDAYNYRVAKAAKEELEAKRNTKRRGRKCSEEPRLEEPQVPQEGTRCPYCWCYPCCCCRANAQLQQLSEPDEEGAAGDMNDYEEYKPRKRLCPIHDV